MTDRTHQASGHRDRQESTEDAERDAARRQRGQHGEGVELRRPADDERFEQAPLDLRSEVSSLRRAVATVLARNQWHDVVELHGDDGVLVLVDPRHFERVVTNLVQNAVAHAGVGVRIRAFADGADAVLEVRDEGGGIAEENLPHLFERFYKADRSRAGGGTGLGLSIAARNATLIGGTLTVESVQGAGSTFRLRLARHPGPAPYGEVLRDDDVDGRSVTLDRRDRRS